jgi:acetylglutamate kinase
MQTPPRRILVKVGGETLQALPDRQRLAQDLRAVVDSGCLLCIVHGAGPQITAMAAQLGIPTVFKAGRRVTDAAMLSAVALAMCGEVGPLLMASLLEAGVAGVTTPAASGGLVIGHKRPPKAVRGEAEPVDYGLVADVAAVDPTLVEALWAARRVPVLSSLVADYRGQLLNLNADSLVTALVPALRIDEVVLVTGVPGVYRDLTDPASHLPQLTASEIAGLIASGAVQGGMVAKLEEVAQLLASGARQVTLVGYRDEGAITAALAGSPGLRTVIRADA